MCIITNIGTSHIGNLGSKENILKAKLEILEGNKEAIVIINQDDELLHKWIEEKEERREIITYGIKENSRIKAEKIELKEKESEFTCLLDGEKVKVKVPVGGKHFILNSLCAIAVGKTLKIPNEKIKKGIAEFELTKKRMDIQETKNGIKIINDAYNASLESMEASLNYLGEFKNFRKIAVLGDMLELGEYSKKLHEQVGKIVHDNKIDLLICSGEMAKDIESQAKKEGMAENQVYYFKTKKEILKKLKEIQKTGDVILFKASNRMKFFELAEEMTKCNL